MLKTVLELALVLLRILRELLGLFQDIKQPRRPTKDWAGFSVLLRPPSCWRLLSILLSGFQEKSNCSWQCSINLLYPFCILKSLCVHLWILLYGHNRCCRIFRQCHRSHKLLKIKNDISICFFEISSFLFSFILEKLFCCWLRIVNPWGTRSFRIVPYMFPFYWILKKLYPIIIGYVSTSCLDCLVVKILKLTYCIYPEFYFIN